MERKKFKHSKYPIYESYLVPILSWDEINDEIIKNYTDPKEYLDKHEITEIDDLVKKQTDKFGNVSKGDLENTLKYLLLNQSIKNMFLNKKNISKRTLDRIVLHC